MQVQSKILFPEITVKRQPPLNLKPGDEIYFQHEYEKKLPPVYLHQLSNVNVSSEGIIFNNKFKVFDPCLIDISRKKHYSYRYLLKNYLKRKKIILSENEKYVLAFDEWSNGYFHWMCDVLPRLIAVETMLADSYVLLPEKFNAHFISEALKLFTYKGIQIIPDKHYVNTSSLIMPEHIATTGNYNPDVMLKIKNKIIAQYKNTSIQQCERIYISRKKAAYRHILNEEEVLNVLKPYNFKIIFFEDYSWGEQISIMKNAKFLIGVIGANLVNMIFMKPDSYVLQFTTQDNGYDNCYFSLANIFNINFLYQFCKYQDTKPGAYWNLNVDINTLKKNLEIMFP